MNQAKMAELCQPCKEVNKTTTSDGFCRGCEESMCQTCFQQHLTARYCRNHVLLELTANERRKTSWKSVDKCEKHENQPVRYYCRKHDQVGCGDCMLFEGHSACLTERIKNVAANLLQQEEFKSMSQKLKTLSNDNKGNVNKLQENRRCNYEMSANLLEDARGFRSRVDSFLDKGEADISAQTERVRLQNERLLNKVESYCESTASDIEKCQQKLSSAHFSEHVLFIHSVSLKPKFRHIEEAIQKTKALNKIDKYIFSPDQKLNELVVASRSLGTLFKVTEREIDAIRTMEVRQNNDRDQKGTPTIYQIFVKFQTGNTSPFSMKPDDTIESLKKQIHDKEGIPVDQMMLQIAFTGKQLEDEFKVCDYDLRNGSTVNCSIKLREEPQEPKED